MKSHRHLHPACAALAVLSMAAATEDVNVGSGAAPASDDTQAELEEYGSFTLQVDHLTTNQSNADKTVLAVVNSTETAEEALLAQLRYFGDLDLLTSRRLRQELAQIEGKNVVIAYDTPRGHTNIIVDAKVFTDTMNNPQLGGTVLGTHASLLVLGTDMVRAEKARCTEARKAGDADHRPSRVLFYIHGN